MKQELVLKAKDSTINMFYDLEKGKATVSGYVDSATLSKMNLLPDFWNWYFSNVYMAPLTLISAVFTAVALMNECGRRDREG